MSEKRELIAIIAVLVVCIIVIGFLGFSSFQRFKLISNLEAEIQQKNLQLTQAEKLLEDLIAIEKTRHLYAQEVETFHKAIPQSPQETEIYESIKRIANTYNVAIQGLNFKERVDQGEYIKMPISLVITGNYEDVMHTLEDLQQGDRMLNVMMIQLTKTPAGYIQAGAALEAFYTKNAPKEGST